MSTVEFTHYDGCNHRDPDNCSACALTTISDIDGRPGINYAAWPLAYIDNRRAVPERFRGFLREEFRSENEAYVKNLKNQIARFGIVVGFALIKDWTEI